MIDLARFEGWLVEEGYARTSIVKLKRDVATMLSYGPMPPHAKRTDHRLEAYRWAWACFDDWCASTNLDNPLEQPPDPKAHRGRRRRKRKRSRRLNPAESIPTEEWLRLLAIVEKDETPAGRVLDVICSTSLRVGDVLRVSRADLDRGFRRKDGITSIEVKGAKPIVISIRGGTEPEWARLRKIVPKGALVCAAVSPNASDPEDWTANGPAYRKVLRRLKELGERAGISGRAHPHRLRRTVAIQAKRAGVDPGMIQKLLEHDSLRTTDTYLDEAMALEKAAIAGKLRGRG